MRDLPFAVVFVVAVLKLVDVEGASGAYGEGKCGWTEVEAAASESDSPTLCRLLDPFSDDVLAGMAGLDAVLLSPLGMVVAERTRTREGETLTDVVDVQSWCGG